jgi:hypothetical protein
VLLPRTKDTGPQSTTSLSRRRCNIRNFGPRFIQFCQRVISFSTCDRGCSFFNRSGTFGRLFFPAPFRARVRSFRRPTGKPSRSSGMPRCRHSSESSTRKVKTLLSHEVSSWASNVMPPLRGPMRVHAYVQRSATFWRSSALKARCIHQIESD